MWFALRTGQSSQLRLVDEHSIWPAPDGSDSELVVTTEADLTEEVVLSTPRVSRLRYDVEAVRASMTLGDQPPAPWPEVSTIAGRSFELMLTDRGPIVVPSAGAKLPNRLASWFETISEDVRSCWPVPPDNIVAGTSWDAIPAVPGGLPPGAKSAAIKISYRVASVVESSAEVEVKFGVRVVLEPSNASQATQGEGRGDATVKLAQASGFQLAERHGRMELVRPTSRNQLLRSRMVVKRS